MKVCGKTQPCGHTCRELCRYDHPCGCKACDLSLKGLHISHENRPKQRVHVSGDMTVIEDEIRHANFVQNYRDFANGGARGHDASLDAKAERQTRVALTQRLNEVPLIDLSEKGEDEETEESASSTTRSSDNGRRGPRKRYTQTFNADVSVIPRGSNNWQSRSLLDDF